MDLKKLTQNIETKSDLVDFLNKFKDAYLTGKIPWDNNTLETFLDALTAWTSDMDGYYKNLNLELPIRPSWKIIAEMLAAATNYE